MKAFVGLTLATITSGFAGLGLWQWLYQTWQDSPLDRYGPYILALSLLFVAVSAIRTEEEKKWSAFNWPALPALATFGLLNLLARDYDIYIFTALTLFPIFSLSFAFVAGWSGFIRILPVLAVGVLAMPGIPFVLTALSPDTPLQLELGGVLVILLVLQWVVQRWGGPMQVLFEHLTALRAIQASLASIALLGFSLAWVAPETGRSALFDTERKEIAGWRGVPLQVNKNESDLFEGAQISKYVYAHPSGASLSVLRVVSDNVHDIHPPEYCLTGANWALRNRGLTTLETKGGNVRTTELDLTRDNQTIHSRYWFNNGDKSLASVGDLRVQRRHDDSDDFSLYLVTSIRTAGGQTQRAMVEQFLQEAL